MAIRNSLSTFLDQALILNENSSKSMSGVEKAVTSNEKTVKITLTDPSNPDVQTTFTVPGLGWLSNEITRLNNSLSTLTNITDGAGSTIRLADGSYRKIIAAKVPSEAPTITTANNITNFNFKSNWFFEDMLNPLLYVTYDLSGQVSSETENVLIRRYVLDCDTATKIDFFDNNFNGKSTIAYSDFLNAITTNKISYTLDEEVKDLPPRDKRYTGNFSVIQIKNTTDDDTDEVTKDIYLRSLYYTDNRTSTKNTVMLSVGDQVEVVAETITTRFEVTYVNNSTGVIRVNRLEGLDTIKVGADTLRISASKDTKINADIAVGFDEREVIFIKAIDPNSHIPSANWSPGVGFYTNELTITNSDGSKSTLQQYYQKYVVDFGQMLLSYAVDYYPSIREGITPEVPELFAEDMKVVQINNQLTEDTDAQTFRQLFVDKANAKAEIESTNTLIRTKKSAVMAETSSTARKALENELESLTTQLESATSRYNSIISNIQQSYNGAMDYTPKYRVRGFFKMPTPKVSKSSGTQDIIKFKFRYRYLNANGVANQTEEYEYTNGSATSRAAFSNWVETESKLRPRTKNSDGIWIWAPVDTQDFDEVNINQVDIPIQYGEKVEIQAKSVSEAGYPNNCLESAWSESIIISFPDDLIPDDLAEEIAQNRVDSALTVIDSKYSGLSTHISSSFYANEKYFAHSASDIASGFLTSEQNQISLYDKLYELQSSVNQLIEQINMTAGNVVIQLVNSEDSSDVYTLVEGETTKIYAGNYKNELKKLNNKSLENGAIITKMYYINITTDKESGLFLLSKLPGHRYEMVPSSITNSDCNTESGYKKYTDLLDTVDYEYNLYSQYDNVLTASTTASNYYKEYGRYDLVPINMSNSTDDVDFQITSPNMYQSAQSKGQYVYSRFKSIGGTQTLYATTTKTETKTVGKATVMQKYGIFDAGVKFMNGEVAYCGDQTKKKVFTKDDAGLYVNEQDYIGTTDSTELVKKEVELYNNLTQSSIDYTLYTESGLPNAAKQILFRLPKTYTMKSTSQSTLKTSKLQLRMVDTSRTSLTSDELTSLNTSLEKKLKRALNTTSESSIVSEGVVTNSIVPKMQEAYGYADMGRGTGVDLDGTDGTADDGTYETTHLIGYENKARYYIGPETCKSYMFLSPKSHSEIQVGGDTATSTQLINSNDALSIPIIFQYRMTDYKGNILGVSGMKASSAKNTSMANMIGLDFWTDTSSDTPKQYDIVMYATFDEDTTVNSKSTVTDKTISFTTESASTIASLAKDLANSVKNEKGLISKSSLTTIKK